MFAQATAGAPTTSSLTPSGEGLELEFVSHPNDLFSGETSKVRVLLDGKPAAGVSLELVRGDTRFRNELGEQTLREIKVGLVMALLGAASFIAVAVLMVSKPL